GLAATTSPGHCDYVSLSERSGIPVLIFEGRLHHYEGQAWSRVLEPVRLAARLGVRVLLLTNAAGGIRGDLVPGSLMAIRDHIEWTYSQCWRRPGPGALGAARRSPYAEDLIKRLRQAATDCRLELSTGTYA